MKLTKIKLINWHMFSNNTIEMKGNTLITGENASGKSTLMDAIYYVLSGGDQKNFNKAANDKGQRTLESYLRGKLGNENQMYLRSGTDIVGYVMLEFSDNRNKNHLVLGAELEIASSVMNTPHFFVINNYSVRDEDFFDNKIVKSFREIKMAFKTSKFQLDEITGSARDRKKTIGRDIFKIDNYSRFFDLLQNAISFKPIHEVSSFVNGFLLSEDNINLDSLREEIRSYQNIHRLLVKEKEKMEMLREFTPKAEKYIKNLEILNYLNALKIQCSIDKIKNQINRNSIDVERLKDQIEQLKKEEQLLADNRERLNIELYQLRNNEAYKALNEKKVMLNQYQKELMKAEATLKEFLDLLSFEQKLVRKLNFTYRFDDDVKNKDFGLLKVHLENYNNDLSKTKHNLEMDVATLIYEMDKNNKVIKEKIEQLSNLKKGINNYPIEVSNLINIAKEAIIKAYPREKNPEVRPLCEYIEIKDEKWTNALEGYLNTQRFYLVVDPKYFDIVSETYEQFKKDKNIYGCGVINTAKVPSVRVEKNSLVNKIEIVNKYARRYTEYLLGNVICVDDVKDLKRYDCAITPSVMIYKNYVLKACNPKVYNIPYIGKKSIERRIKLLEEEIHALEEKIRKENDEINTQKTILNEISNSKYNQIIKFNNPWSEIERYQKNINLLKEEIFANEQEKGLLEINGRIQTANKQLDKILNEQKINNENMNNSISERAVLNNKIESDKKLLQKENDEFNNAIEKLNKDELKTMINKYFSNGWLNEDLIIKDIFTAQSSNNSVKSVLLNTMQKYSSTYKPSLMPIIESVQDFINEYYRLMNCGVVEYEQKAKEAYERAETLFREDFLSKLKEKIEKSQKTLDKINKNLQLHPFGNDEEIYKFYYEPTKNSEFYNYYRIIMSGKLMEMKDLFTEVLDEKDASFMKDLFNKISMEVNSVEAEKELGRYLDYRNYMNYDIKITNKYGNESFFSKISNEKSGGETQTPFYIVIASCFDELMNKDSNKPESTCQVIFDEAFNNMDESRIKSLMEFYKNLNIQVIIVVPSIRFATIMPYVDTGLGIVKISNHPHVQNLGRKNGNI